MQDGGWMVPIGAYNAVIILFENCLVFRESHQFLKHLKE